VAVRAEALSGLDPVIVQHAQGAEAHVVGIMVIAEGERVPAVEPSPLGVPPLLGAPNLDHRPRNLNSASVVSVPFSSITQ
jgi:hypothetical protein